jgi:predicted nucleotidyltransferase
MRRDEVIAKLKEAEPALKAFGVAALYLFGSHARDEAGPNSDVDVLSIRPLGSRRQKRLLDLIGKLEWDETYDTKAERLRK